MHARLPYGPAVRAMAPHAGHGLPALEDGIGKQFVGPGLRLGRGLQVGGIADQGPGKARLGVTGHGLDGGLCALVFVARALAQHCHLRPAALAVILQGQVKHVVFGARRAQDQLGVHGPAIVRGGHFQHTVRREPRPQARQFGGPLQGFPGAHARFHSDLLPAVPALYVHAVDAQGTQVGGAYLRQGQLAPGQHGRGAVQQDARPVPAVQFQAMFALGQTAAHGVHTAREDHVRTQTHLHLGPGLYIVGDGCSRDAQGQAPGIGGREKVAVYAVAFPVPVLMPGDGQGDGIGISGHKQAAPDLWRCASRYDEGSYGWRQQGRRGTVKDAPCAQRT